MNELDNISGLSLGTPIEAEKSDDLKAYENDEQKKDFQKAALIDHPGWEQIASQMRSDIDRIRAFTDVDMKQYTDKELGEVVRGELRVASKLEEYLSSVEEAVKAVAIYADRRNQTGS